MRFIYVLFSIIFILVLSSPAQSWYIYNAPGTDAETLDGLDSTAFALQSSFAAYTSTAGDGVEGAFVSYTTPAGGSFVNITTETIIKGKLTSGLKSHADGNYTTALGGYSSMASAGNATSLGGYRNIASGPTSTVTGGQDNIASDIYTMVSGGLTNRASNEYAVVVGGRENTSSGIYATSMGGWNADATGDYSLAQGLNTTASGFASFAVGQTVSTAGFGAVGFGTSIVNAGDYSTAFGRHASLSAAADRTFADIYSLGAINITQPNAHIIFGNVGYEKKVGIQTITPRYELDVVGDIGNAGSVLFEGMVTVYDNYSVTLGDYTIFANATSNAKTMYLPDATTVDGMHVRLKKKDSTHNHISVCGVGGQTIDGDNCRVLEAENNAIMVYSEGSNWEVLQATSVSHYGEIHVHGNSTATDIDTASIPHLVQGLFSEEMVSGFDFIVGSTGPIASFAEYSTVVSGTTKVTDVDHGLASGAILSIAGTTDYNGVYEATVIDSANYYIFDGYSGTDTGNWYEGDKFTSATGKTATYTIDFHGFGTPETNNDILAFHLYKNATEITNLESKGKFTSATDVKPMSAGGLITLDDGDIITLAVTNTSGTGDFTLEHINIVIHSF